MTDIATSEPRSVTRAPTRLPRQRLSPKMRFALNLLATGECRTQKAAAAQAGLHEVTISKTLRSPAGQSFIAEKARAAIRTGALRASHRLVELIDAESEHVSADVAKHILAIEGVKPPESGGVQVNVMQSVGYVVDWRSDRQQIQHQPQDEPNALNNLKDVTPKPETTPKE